MSEPCWATWGEPGNGELDCILDMGHEGSHRVEWEWDAERPEWRCCTCPACIGMVGERGKEQLCRQLELPFFQKISPEGIEAPQ